MFLFPIYLQVGKMRPLPKAIQQSHPSLKFKIYRRSQIFQDLTPVLIGHRIPRVPRERFI